VRIGNKPKVNTLMHYQRALIAALACLLLASACGKPHHSRVPSLPEATGGGAQVSQASDYGFGTDGFTPGVDFYPDRFVVGFKDGAKAARASSSDANYNTKSRLYQNTDIAALAREIRDTYGVRLDKEAYVRSVNFAGYQTKGGSCAKEIMQRIQADYAGAVEYIEYDGARYLQYVPNDPDYPANLWGMQKIDAEGAWETERGNDSVMVCVIDTGVRYSADSVSGYPDHEDLAANYLHPPTYWPDETFDIFDNDNVPEDEHFHGTHCSGTIGAVGDNSKGVVGVVHDISMVMIRVFGPSGGCPDSWVATAVTLATEIESDVISMSLGGTFPNLATKEACEGAYNSGIFLSVAAANSNTDKPYYPGYYDVNCAVGATDSSDNRAGFSCYGQWVDIAAPGVNVKSCTHGSTSSYGWASGTSMATPHVAGAAALLLSYDPTLTPAQLRAALESTGPDLNDEQWGNPDIKRLDVYAALNFVVNDEFGTPPTAEITAPSDNDSVSGDVTIDATASDSDGSILKVSFLLNGDLMGTDDAAPYSYEWDSTKYVNGSYELKAVALDNQRMTGTDTITVTVSNTCVTPNYFNDFEGATTGWWSLNEVGSGYWQLVSNDGASGTHSYHLGGDGGGNYSNIDFDRLFSPVFDLSGLEAVRLKFKHHYSFTGNDYGYLLVNDGSHDFIFLDWYGPGTVPSWTQKSYSLDSYIGKSVQIVFFFEAGGGQGPGWWVDDFAIEKKTPPCSIEITSPGSGADVSGVTGFAADVTDDVGVTLVKLLVDDTEKASFTDSGPYEYSWITTNYHGGYHNLSVYTEDEWPTANSGSIAAYVKNHAITDVDIQSAETGTSITIDGSYFIADAGDVYNPATDKVFFSSASGWSEAAVTTWTADEITATVPEDVVTGAVCVDINGAPVASSFEFTVLPRLDALSPVNQVVGGNITLEGSGFGGAANGDSEVSIGGIGCSVMSWGSNEIVVTIPPGVTQSNLTVTVTAGVSNAIQFTPKPNILSFTPARTWMGQELTIGGTSFGAAQGLSTVLFTGPVFAGPGDIVSWNDSEIVMRVPFGARQGDVTITANGVASDGEFLLIVLTPPELGGLGQY
jgi:subtilisin family serine protease